MSNFMSYGTLTADGSTDWVSVRGWVTCITTGTWDSGTMTWKIKGPDGNEITVFAGTDNITAQAYTQDHMVNFYFGDDVKLRGTLSGAGGSADLDWQILSNPANRG